MRRPWYKRDGAAFISGTMGLTLEEKGAYSLCLDLIYSEGGPIHDDARWLAGVCGVSLRKWTSLRDRLISLGKLSCDGGYLMNPRAMREIAALDNEHLVSVESGSKGGRKRAENSLKPMRNKLESDAKPAQNDAENEAATSKNNSLRKGPLNHIEEDKEIEGEQNRDTPSLRSGGGTSVAPEPDLLGGTSEAVIVPHPAVSKWADLDTAYEAYNKIAAQHDWAICQKRTRARDMALRKRLSDAGGSDGWLIALEKAAASDFLCGRVPSRDGRAPFMAHIDFLLQESSFVKLMEGQYDNRTQPAGHASPSGVDKLDRSIIRAAANFAAKNGRGNPQEAGLAQSNLDDAVHF